MSHTTLILLKAGDSVKGRIYTFTIVTAVLGFMVAVLFQSTKEVEVRDTRNIMELQQALTSEKERQQELNEEIAKQLEHLSQLQQGGDVEEVMESAMEELKYRAGLTEVSGPGVILEISPVFDENFDGGAIRSVPPYLLRMLINELNINGASEIAVASQRVVSTSAIREANGVTLVNSSRVTQFPLRVRVITDDPEGLHYAMMSSSSREMFSYENLSLESSTVTELVLPAYDKPMRVRHMELIKEDS